MNNLNVVVKGTSPLLMHNCCGVNPLNPVTKEIKKLTSKKKKTDEDLELISNLEYQNSIYYDEKIGPYIPAENVEACLRDAAKKNKKGKDFTMAVMVLPDKIPIEYAGPRDIESLVQDMKFRDCRPVNVMRAKTMRTRPRFNNWKMKFSIEYSPDVIEDADTVISALKTAGAYNGLGDYRPRYGRFEVVEVKK